MTDDGEMTSKRDASKNRLRLSSTSVHSSFSSPSETSSGYCSGTDDDGICSPVSNGGCKGGIVDGWLPGVDLNPGFGNDEIRCEDNSFEFGDTTPSWVAPSSSGASTSASGDGENDALTLFRNIHGESELEDLDEFLYFNVDASSADVSRDEPMKDKYPTFAFADLDDTDYCNVWKQSEYDDDVDMTSLLSEPENGCFLPHGSSPDLSDMLTELSAPEVALDCKPNVAEVAIDNLPRDVDELTVFSNIMLSSVRENQSEQDQTTTTTTHNVTMDALFTFLTQQIDLLTSSAMSSSAATMPVTSSTKLDSSPTPLSGADNSNTFSLAASELVNNLSLIASTKNADEVKVGRKSRGGSSKKSTSKRKQGATTSLPVRSRSSKVQKSSSQTAPIQISVPKMSAKHEPDLSNLFPLPDSVPTDDVPMDGFNFQAVDDQMSFCFADFFPGDNLLETEDNYPISDDGRGGLMDAMLDPDDFISSFQLQQQQQSEFTPVMDLLDSSQWSDMDRGEFGSQAGMEVISDAVLQHPVSDSTQMMFFEQENTACNQGQQHQQGTQQQEGQQQQGQHKEQEQQQPQQQGQQQQQQQQSTQSQLQQHPPSDQSCQEEDDPEGRAKVLAAILMASKPLNANQGSDVIYEDLTSTKVGAPGAPSSKETSVPHHQKHQENVCDKGSTGSSSSNNLLHRLLKGQINEADIMRKCEELKRKSKEKIISNS